MRTDRLMAVACITLALGLATIAVVGPLGLGWLDWRISDNQERQLLAIDAVSLFLVAPTALIAGFLWWRGRRIAPVMALSSAVYTVYFLFQDILTPEYLRYEGNNEQFFPLIYAVLVIGVVLAVKAWSSIDPANIPLPARRQRLTTAAILLGLGLFLALGWGSWVADIMRGNTAQVEYQEHPAGSWLVKTMDLTFLIPALIATGIGLIRRHPVAVKAAYGLVGALTYLAAAVGGMGIVMAVQDDPSTDPIFIAVTVPATFALAAVTVRLWQSFDPMWRRPRTPATPRKERETPDRQTSGTA